MSESTAQLLLDARDVRFAYGATPVLNGVSLRLHAGEVVALLGPNGSGKSTLLRTVAGQLRGGGTVQWEGRDVRSWSTRELAKRLAYLPQSPTWSDEQTVLDVLRLGRAPYWGAFGLESERDATVVHGVIELLQLRDLLARRLDELSGGQRQRVFIGRCLAQQPRALLLDEPNTFLDLRHQIELGQLLGRLARDQGIGVLMASHDLNLAGTLAGRVVVLSAGTVRAEGRPADVFTDEVLSDAYGIAVRCARLDEQVVVLPSARPD